MDDVMHWLRLAYPLVFLIGGVAAMITTIIGSPKSFEESRNPNMRELVARWGRKKVRISYVFFSIGMMIFGGWLLYCWLVNGTA